jgi:hypothetical protein
MNWATPRRSSGLSVAHAGDKSAMKALVLLTAVALALSSVAASAQYVGKGKAPPPPAPVATKG